MPRFAGGSRGVRVFDVDEHGREHMIANVSPQGQPLPGAEALRLAGAPAVVDAATPARVVAPVAGLEELSLRELNERVTAAGSSHQFNRKVDAIAFLQAVAK